MLKYELISHWLDDCNPAYCNEIITKLLKKPFDTTEFDSCVKSRALLDLMPGFYDKDKYDISFDSCATNHIKNLVNEYCDKDTIIITSCTEHPSICGVLEPFAKQRTTFNLDDDYKKIRLPDVRDRNVFVYVIGTRMSNGVVTPADLYMFLRNTLVMKGARKVTIVLDDVQGMFLVPRNYAVDYVIGTAHNIVSKFDLGILLSKKTNKKIGHYWDNIGYEYYLTLKDLLDNYRVKFYQFNMVMQDVFSRCPMFESHKINTSPYIYSYRPFTKKGEPIIVPDIMVEKVHPYTQFESNDEKCYFRFRSHEVMHNYTEFIDKLKLIDKFLMSKI